MNKLWGIELLSFLSCNFNAYRWSSLFPTKNGVETDEDGRHSASRSFWLEDLELVFLHILSVEVAGVSNVDQTVEASSVAGDTASLTEKLLGYFKTFIPCLGGLGVWVYFYGGTVS